MDPLQWMGAEWESKQLIKIITIIHTSSGNQLMSFKAKKLHVCKKRIHF